MKKARVIKSKPGKTQYAERKQGTIKAEEPATPYQYNSTLNVDMINRWENFYWQTNKGVGISEVEKLVEAGPFRSEFFAAALDFSTKTLERYKQDKKRLNPNDSELVLKWKKLYDKGLESFGNYESFGRWLQKPAYGLNGIAPMEMMKTSSGVDLLIEELVRIDWGQLS